MARTLQLSHFTQRLKEAALARDWHALAAADHEIAQALPGLALLGEWTLTELRAFEALRAAHEQARAQCAAAAESLNEQMADLRALKDGWLAYAMHAELQDPKA